MLILFPENLQISRKKATDVCISMVFKLHLFLNKTYEQRIENTIILASFGVATLHLFRDMRFKKIKN